MATVTIFHNNARDEAGRHEAWSRGDLPGDTVTEVFRYETRAGDPLPLPFALDLCNVGHEPDDRTVTYRARGTGRYASVTSRPPANRSPNTADIDRRSNSTLTGSAPNWSTHQAGRSSNGTVRTVPCAPNTAEAT